MLSCTTLGIQRRTKVAHFDVLFVAVILLDRE